MALEAGKVPSKMIIFFLFSAGGLCPPPPPPGLRPGPAGGLRRSPRPLAEIGFPPIPNFFPSIQKLTENTAISHSQTITVIYEAPDRVKANTRQVYQTHSYKNHKQ